MEAEEAWHLLAPAYAPNATGAVERPHRIINAKLKAFAFQSSEMGQSWVRRVKNLMRALNERPDDKDGMCAIERHNAY